jgi:hypothetical protein
MKKKIIIASIALVVVAAVIYFIRKKKITDPQMTASAGGGSGNEPRMVGGADTLTPAQKLEVAYPGIYNVIKGMYDYDKKVGRKWLADRSIIDYYVNYTKNPVNGAKNPPREAYFKAIDYKVDTFVEHCQILGIV